MADYVNEIVDDKIDDVLIFASTELREKLSQVVTESMSGLINEAALILTVGDDGLTLDLIHTEDLPIKKFNLEELLEFMIDTQAGTDSDFQFEISNINKCHSLADILEKTARMLRRTAAMEAIHQDRMAEKAK